MPPDALEREGAAVVGAAGQVRRLIDGFVRRCVSSNATVRAPGAALERVPGAAAISRFRPMPTSRLIGRGRSLNAAARTWLAVRCILYKTFSMPN